MLANLTLRAIVSGNMKFSNQFLYSQLLISQICSSWWPWIRLLVLVSLRKEVVTVIIHILSFPTYICDYNLVQKWPFSNLRYET